MMAPGATAIVGAAESTYIGTVPGVSSTGLALDGAANALADAGLSAADIDGLDRYYERYGDPAGSDRPTIVLMQLMGRPRRFGRKFTVS